MNMPKYKFPKFKKGNQVTTPDGKGKITALMWANGKNWYEVENKWFAENEIH